MLFEFIAIVFMFGFVGAFAFWLFSDANEDIGHLRSITQLGLEWQQRALAAERTIAQMKTVLNENKAPAP